MHRYFRKSLALCINRNIVECKFDNYFIKSSYVAVLIETLWNVNSFVSSDLYFLISVLIETLWNVNIEATSFQAGLRFCINRNIVECKFTWHSDSEFRGWSINRNIVECKFV